MEPSKSSDEYHKLSLLLRFETNPNTAQFNFKCDISLLFYFIHIPTLTFITSACRRFNFYANLLLNAWMSPRSDFCFSIFILSSALHSYVSSQTYCSVILRSLTRQLQKMLWLLSTSLKFIRFIIYFNDLNPFNFELVINCSFIFDSDRVCTSYIAWIIPWELFSHTNNFFGSKLCKIFVIVFFPQKIKNYFFLFE